MKEGDCCSICSQPAEKIADRSEAARTRLKDDHRWLEETPQHVEYVFDDGTAMNIRVATQQELSEATLHRCISCSVQHVCTVCALNGHRTCPECSETSWEHMRLMSK